MMEDKQPIIVRLISPARPILHRSGSPLHSIYQQRFAQLPKFHHISQQDQALHRDQQSPKSTPQRHTYPVYIRNICQTWDFTPPKPQPPPPPNLPTAPQQTLQFQSNFESGNLKQADKVFGEQEYNLIMQRDVNTYGYTQWFFFKVTKAVEGRRYKFNLVNFYKQHSLYQKGMRVLVYSVRENAVSKRGWHRDGTNIQYYQNQTAEILSDGKVRNYYTLTFDYCFRHANDQVFFAYNYPYTYTELNNYLDTLEVVCKPIMHRTTLTRTLAGNRVEILTISNFSNPKPKKIIFITGRVHPGEAVSSYITKGVIDYLTSDDENAFQLRDNFIFKIVPMVNPDGVIHGNYRSNLAGSDLNRKWETPSKRLHPEIYALKKAILELAQRTQILMFCDMHGHSKKKNAFIYGCTDKSNPLSTKEFPYLVSKASKSFSFQDCSFGIKQDKRGTARAVLWKTLSIPNVFTLQTSFCGPVQPQVHFGYRHFEQIGKRFCETLLLHFQDELECDEDEDGITINTKVFGGVGGVVRRNALEELYGNKKYLDNNQEEDSDSQVSVDAISDRELLALEKGSKFKPREMTRRRQASSNQLQPNPNRQRTPVPSRTRRRPNPPTRLPSKLNPNPNLPRPPSPSPTNPSAMRTLYRQKLPLMFLQPKIFTIVQAPNRANWSYQSYQAYQQAYEQTNMKSQSFANRRSFKGAKREVVREEMLGSLVVGRERGSEERRSLVGRRHRTEPEFDDRNMTIDFDASRRRKWDKTANKY